MSGDSRKDFILATAGNYFGISAKEYGALADNGTLNSFLDDGNVSVLAAKLDNSKKIVLANKVQTLYLCTVSFFAFPIPLAGGVTHERVS